MNCELDKREENKDDDYLSILMSAEEELDKEAGKIVKLVVIELVYILIISLWIAADKLFFGIQLNKNTAVITMITLCVNAIYITVLAASSFKGVQTIGTILTSAIVVVLSLTLIL